MRIPNFLRTLLRPLAPLYRRLRGAVRLARLEGRVRRLRREGARLVFLYGTPIHGNLGDHAIASATLRLLAEALPGRTVVELPDGWYRGPVKTLEKAIGSDPIVLQGGGSMGTIWFEAERWIRELFETYRDTVIFAMPQTIFYEDSEWGRRELKRSVEIYNAHPRLTLCAREKTSYEAMRALYPKTSVFLFPDIVTSLKKDDFGLTRGGVLTCLRGDREATLNEAERGALLAAARGLSPDVRATDMIYPGRILPGEREARLREKYAQFASARLVITDRLHAMIFSAITGTPCVAMDNSSGKVRGVYREWLEPLGYIRFADSADEAARLAAELYPLGGQDYDRTRLEPQFERLGQALRSALAD